MTCGWKAPAGLGAIPLVYLPGAPGGVCVGGL